MHSCKHAGIHGSVHACMYACVRTVVCDGNNHSALCLYTWIYLEYNLSSSQAPVESVHGCVKSAKIQVRPIIREVHFDVTQI